MASHALAYAIAAPDPGHRALLLAATGHGSSRPGEALTLGVLVAALCGYALDRASNGGPPTRQSSSYRFIAARLMTLQVMAFVALEFAERASIGHASAFADEAVLPIGIIVQIVSALVGAGLLGLVARAVDGIVAGDGRRARRVASADLLWPVWELARRPHVLPARGRPTLRAPPISH